MQKSALIGTIVAALFLGSANALAGPGKTAWAYGRGDDVPAMRPLRKRAPTKPVGRSRPAPG